MVTPLLGVMIGGDVMRRPMVLIALLVSLSGAYGQSRQPVIRISPFSGSGVSTSEASMLERLVNSYIVELKAFRVIDAQGQEMALSETEAALSLGTSTAVSVPLTADYIVGGAIGKVGDIYVFTLENTKVSSGEKLSVSDTAHSISDIVLRARNLTRSLFGKQDAIMPGTASSGTSASYQADGSRKPAADAAGSGAPIADAQPAIYESPSPALLAGSWKGDKGLETVRLFPNGTGLAVLSGGGTLKLRVSISGHNLYIDQDQPNDVALYRADSVKLALAKRIAATARAMRWTFTLRPGGATLAGMKASVAISGSGTSLTVDNDYEREASWDRISR